MSIDTLKYAKELEAAGEKPEIAEAHATILKSVIDENLVTKDYLDMKLVALLNEIRTIVAEALDPFEKKMDTRFMAQQTRFIRIETYLLIIGSISLGALPALIKFYS